MGRTCTILTALAILFAGAAASHATPLGLVPGTPDVFSGFVSISYDAGTDAFEAVGTPVQYNAPPVDPMSGGVFALTATIDANGVVSGGSLSISGTTASASGVLLTGSVVQFGFAPDGVPGAPTFEFICSATGGALLADYGGTGAPIGVIISSFDSFAGNLDVNFTGSTGLADTFSPVPEPTSMTLLAVGIVGTLWARRRKKPAQAER